jgi:lipopolysaccharide export system protein LptC
MLNMRNFFLLSFAVLVIYLLSRVSGTSDESAATADVIPEQDFDYYITGMSNTRFDAAGKPTYKLEATRVTHYPDTDTAKMENPHFFYFDVDARPWEVTAAAGTLSTDPARNEDHLELTDNVLVRHEMNAGDFLVASTESLDVFPDSEELHTEAPVTLEAGGSHLESTGMRAFFNEEKIELQTAVRGFHE